MRRRTGDLIIWSCIAVLAFIVLLSTLIGAAWGMPIAVGATLTTICLVLWLVAFLTWLFV